MAKITCKIVVQPHEWEKCLVRRPYGNETLVEPGPGESAEKILAAIQQAIAKISPYVQNCPIHNWAGSPATYITVQPLKDPLRAQVWEGRAAALAAVRLHTHARPRLRRSPAAGDLHVVARRQPDLRNRGRGSMARPLQVWEGLT